MGRKILTPRGEYEYKPIIVYEGIKRIDKIKAKENLLLFKKVANKNGLIFGLAFGTFLGAMREHDFIEHDEDIDLFVLNENKDIFLSMLFELRENGFDVIRYDRRGDLCSIMRDGEYIDILFFRKISGEVRLAQSYFLPRHFVEDITSYDFQGDKFYGAKDGPDFLLFWYGENWRIPIQRDNFNLPIWKKVIAKLKWIVYENLPNFVFSYIILKRTKEKVNLYNKRISRYNNYKQNVILKTLSCDRKKIKEIIGY